MSLVLNCLFIAVCLSLFDATISRQIITVNRYELEAERNYLNTKSFQTNTKTEEKSEAQNNTEVEIASENTAVNPQKLSGAKTRKKQRKRHHDEPNMWFHCADESTPTRASWHESNRGVMCSTEYPFHTCCSHHDLTVDLFGSKMADVVSYPHCVHLLKKLRCAHCSPRSWWLFHAPDKRRLPHKRFIPILCHKFCKEFHSACRDSIADMQNDNFCEFHTNTEEGPCFPDYKIRKGSID